MLTPPLPPLLRCCRRLLGCCLTLSLPPPLKCCHCHHNHLRQSALTTTRHTLDEWPRATFLTHVANERGFSIAHMMKPFPHCGCARISSRTCGSGKRRPERTENQSQTPRRIAVLRGATQTLQRSPHVPATLSETFSLNWLSLLLPGHPWLPLTFRAAAASIPRSQYNAQVPHNNPCALACSLMLEELLRETLLLLQLVLLPFALSWEDYVSQLTKLFQHRTS